jgi:four helix bundle protein
MAERIESFRDLIVYQKAFSLQQNIFEISKSFPKEELFSLTDQVRRSSRSIGSNIAEAWHKRRYVAHFVSKLTDSDGEQAESQHWIHTAYQCKYISTEKRDGIVEQCMEIGRMLGSMISNPEKFCRYKKK